MNKAIDCLLVHSVMHGGGKISCQVMPMGFFSMADFLVKNGYKCRIVNIGIEKFLNRNFSITNCIKKYSPKVIGIDLHWYTHSFSAIELARLVKEHCDARVILGGYTASFFSKEIMETFPFIDGVISGEGEISLLAYLKNLDKKSFEKVPNFTFRCNGEVKCPKKLYPSEISLLNDLTYSNVFLMDHWETYAFNSAGSDPVTFICSKERPKRMFFLPFGRGCSVNCSYCSGGANSCSRLTGRKEAYCRPIEMILHDIKALYKLGIDGYCVENYPPSGNDDFYVTLFNKLGAENLDIGINFGCWHPPTDEFLDAFARTFNLKKSCLSISPESGSEYVRKINKGLTYSNIQLFEMIEKIRARGIHGSIHFSLGMPGESYSHFKETLKMFDRLKKTEFYLSIRGIPIEPGSPMWMNPQRYKIKKSRNSFMDYYTTYRALFNHQTPSHPLGYRTADFSENEISKLEIKAYRKFYMRPGFFFDRVSRIKNIGDIKENFKVFFAVLIGSTNLLNRVER